MRYVAQTNNLFHWSRLQRQPLGATRDDASDRAGTLWREISGMALLFRDFEKRVEIHSSREGLIRFRQRSDAANDLRQLSNAPELATSLRKVLHEYHGLDVSRLTDAQVIEETLRRLENGMLQLMEVFDPRIEAPATVEAKPSAEPVTEIIPLPARPDLLPLLEELQIEGATVLPEIMQALEQLDIAIEGIGVASVSLDPAPSKIPSIGATMLSSSTSITDTLAAL